MKTTSIEETKKYLELYDLPLKELQDQAQKIRQKHFGNKVEFCSIISVKTGKCGENCIYCAQSSHFKANCKTHDLINIDTVVKAAKDSRENGASRFCVVTSGKGIANPKEFDVILEMVNAVSKIKGLHSCCSLGIVSYKEALMLKEAGVERFNHNLNTSKSFYKNICTTHEYEERLHTAGNIINAGIELCCGGIIGLGESRKQRIEMALEIKSLNPKSVPINILIPIPGTPTEKLDKLLSVEEILKTIALYRIILPEVFIRYAGGRATHLNEEEQKLGFKCGINALLVGNYLTTTGTDPHVDKKLIKSEDLEIIEG